MSHNWSVSLNTNQPICRLRWLCRLFILHCIQCTLLHCIIPDVWLCDRWWVSKRICSILSNLSIIIQAYAMDRFESLLAQSKCIVKAQTALRKQKNKIWRKTIFNMAHGILTSCNMARSWHWFCQVTAPCNVACGSGIMTLNSLSGSKPTLQRDMWLWEDMSLNSPCSITLQCGM